MTAPRVLIIDDAVTVRAYHRALVEQLGATVDEAINGVEAMEQALRKPHDLWIVDVNMPTMDGLRFLSLARQNDRIRAVPAVVVTTETGLRDRAQAWRAGANLFLIKPVDPAVFCAHVAVLLGSRPS